LQNQTEQSNDTICCNNPAVGANGTQFCGSLGEIGSEWVADIDSFCSNLGQSKLSCSEQNLTSFRDCVTNSSFDFAKRLNATNLYAYMQNHANGVIRLVDYCQANETKDFGNLTEEDVSQMFLFDFGNLSQAFADKISNTTEDVLILPVSGASGSEVISATNETISNSTITSGADIALSGGGL